LYLAQIPREPDQNVANAQGALRKGKEDDDVLVDECQNPEIWANGRAIKKPGRG